ncbi:MAG: ATP synthase F1 subunit gamma [Bacilli bacterium]
MAKGLPVLRRRITSIKATKKVTKAMQMIATTKLKTWKQSMLESRLYAEKLVEIVQTNLHHESLKGSIFFKEDSALPTLYIVITSNLGLCGPYNYNVLTQLTKMVKPRDVIYAVGEKSIRFLKNTSLNYQADFINAGSLSEATLSPLIQGVLTAFKNRKVGQVHIIYTKFVNSLIFQPSSLRLLPLSLATFQGKTIIQPPLIEPDPLSVFEKLVPFYLKNATYSTLIESQVSEQSSRRNAMEKASDNADELVEQLQLDFNKQRQANITQEIAEIIGGASS